MAAALPLILLLLPLSHGAAFPVTPRRPGVLILYSDEPFSAVINDTSKVSADFGGLYAIVGGPIRATTEVRTNASIKYLVLSPNSIFRPPIAPEPVYDAAVFPERGSGEVVLCATVRNIGEVQGQLPLEVVMDGSTVMRAEVDLEPGDLETLCTHGRPGEGRHVLSVDGASAEFEVLQSPEDVSSVTIESINRALSGDYDGALALLKSAPVPREKEDEIIEFINAIRGFGISGSLELTELPPKRYEVRLTVAGDCSSMEYEGDSVIAAWKVSYVNGCHLEAVLEPPGYGLRDLGAVRVKTQRGSIRIPLPIVAPEDSSEVALAFSTALVAGILIVLGASYLIRSRKLREEREMLSQAVEGAWNLLESGDYRGAVEMVSHVVVGEAAKMLGREGSAGELARYMEDYDLNWADALEIVNKVVYGGREVTREEAERVLRVADGIRGG